MRKTIISGLKWMAVPTAFSAILNVVKILILVRYIPTADFGLFAISSIFVGMGIMLLESGASASLVQKEERSSKAIAAIFSFNIAWSITLFILNSIVAFGWVLFYKLPELFPITFLHGFLLLLYGLGVTHKSILQRDLKFSSWASIELVAVIANFFCTLTFAVIGYGVYALVIGMLLQYGFLTVFLWLKTPILHFSFTWKDFRPHTAFVKIHLLERLSTHIVFQLDTILIGRLLGTEALGIYDIFKRILMRPSDMITTVAERVYFPILSKTSSDRTLFTNHFSELLWGISTLQFPLYIGLFLFGPTYISFFLGESWGDHSFSFQAVCLLVMAQILSNPMDTIFLATNKIVDWLYASLMIAPLVGLAIWIGSLYGTLSLVIFFLSGVYLALTIGSFLWLKYRYKLLSIKQLANSVFYPLALSCICAVLIWPLMETHWLSLILFITLNSIGFILINYKFVKSIIPKQ